MANTGNKILAVVGLAGSGKTTVADYVASMGYPKIYFGGIVLDMMTEQGLEHTPENEKQFREKLRLAEGVDFVGRQATQRMRKLIEAGQKRIIADGLYSWTEYKFIKKEFPGELIVVAVVTNKRLRHRRLLTRPVRPLSQAEADHRDWDEIENLEKGGPIAVADYYLTNDGTLNNLYDQVDRLLTKTNFLT